MWEENADRNYLDINLSSVLYRCDGKSRGSGIDMGIIPGSVSPRDIERGGMGVYG